MRAGVAPAYADLQSAALAAWLTHRVIGDEGVEPSSVGYKPTALSAVLIPCELPAVGSNHDFRNQTPRSCQLDEREVERGRGSRTHNLRGTLRGSVR